MLRRPCAQCANVEARLKHADSEPVQRGDGDEAADCAAQGEAREEDRTAEPVGSEQAMPLRDPVDQYAAGQRAYHQTERCRRVARPYRSQPGVRRVGWAPAGVDSLTLFGELEQCGTLDSNCQADTEVRRGVHRSAVQLLPSARQLGPSSCWRRHPMGIASLGS